MLGVTLGFTPNIPYPHQHIHYKSNYDAKLLVAVTYHHTHYFSASKALLQSLLRISVATRTSHRSIGPSCPTSTIPELYRLGFSNVPADNHGYPKTPISEFWHLLQNARTDFHQKSLSLKIETTESVIKALDQTKVMFDIVFVRCVSQQLMSWQLKLTKTKSH